MGYRTDAERIARQAGDLLRREHAKPRQITHKGRIDLVTQADEAAETLIVEALRTAYPEHAILTEEAGAVTSGDGLIWYIDPLDGTTNFAHGFPHFCVSIALYDGEGPLVGVVYDPLADEMFSARRSEGAYLNGEEMRVTTTGDLREALVATGFPYNRHTAEDNNSALFSAFLRRTQGMRRAGAAALDMAYVAAGRLDGYWEMGLRPWDMAAGLLLVLEAGGTVTGYYGQPEIPITDEIRLVASNGHIHAAMLAVIAS